MGSWNTEVQTGVGRNSETETLSLIDKDTRKQLYKIISVPDLALGHMLSENYIR